MAILSIAGSAMATQYTGATAFAVVKLAFPEASKKYKRKLKRKENGEKGVKAGSFVMGEDGGELELS